jgi:hypothetical protein
MENPIRWFSYGGKQEMKAYTGVKDLMFQGGTIRPSRSLPRSAFSFAPTLLMLRLSPCFIPDIDATPMLLFTRLKQIQLENFYILEVGIKRLLASCTMLEDLWLERTMG